MFTKKYKNKKNQKIKKQQSKNKSKKYKKKIGGEINEGEINEDDIMYQDSLVCILKPNIKKGIIVFTNFVQNDAKICDIGLKTGKQLESEGINFGRKKIHPYMFFRAPYFSPIEIDYSSIQTEIISLYEKTEVGKKNRIYIRVDPNKTFVFSSEIRAHTFNNSELEKSKKTLSEYLTIIADNAKIYGTLFPMSESKKQPAYHLYTSVLIPIENYGMNYIEPSYPLTSAPTERNNEILVSLPHLTPNYFVLCE